MSDTQMQATPEEMCASTLAHYEDVSMRASFVTMKPMSAAQIDAYVASGEWQDKAGAYAIQETADAFIERVEGSWSNVVGLPMELLARMFEQAAGMIDAGE